MILEFWDWYISLFSSSNNLERLAVWTATLTTLGFVFKYLLLPVFTFLRFRISGISVSASITQNVTMSSFLGNSISPPSLICTILNKENSPIYIKSPTIKFSRKISNDNHFQIPRMKGEYPKKVEPGEQVEEEYNLLNLHDHFSSSLKPNDYIRFQIETTNGIKYMSNKIKNKQIIVNVDIAKNQKDNISKKT